MTETQFTITRRKALAALGSVGVASAGAGLGTTAFFSDEETYVANRLTAGSLDLKLDWQEHYSDWSDDEAAFAGMASSLETADYVLPGGDVGEDILLDFVDEGGKAGFMAATGIEAYPDTDDDGVQDFPDGWFNPESENYICQLGADTPEDLDPDGGTGLRSRNADTVLNWPLEEMEDAQPAPLINLTDVKPGDFGEVTFSLHLCDNPGYVWMFADNLAASENGVNEPEAADADEDQNQDGSLKDPENDPDGVTVELLDAIQARAWYDTNGDNLLDDLEIPIVEQGSLREVITALTSDPGLKLRAPCFAGLPVLDDGDGDDGDGADGDGTVQIEPTYPLDCEPSSPLGVPSNPRCESYGYDGVRYDVSEIDPDLDVWQMLPTKTIMLDGSEFEVRVEVMVTSLDDGDPQRFKFRNLEVRELPDGDFVPAGTCLVMVKGGPRANLCRPFDHSTDPDPTLVPTAGTDDVLESPVNNGGNVPAISHVDFCICEVGDGDDGNGVPPLGGPEDCLVNSTTYFVGFEWWLPVDHGNEVQTDSVSFDLGFYTEQCRHNDGSGMSRVEVEEDSGGAGGS